MYVNISILYVYCRQPILSLHVPDNETRILEIFSLPITEINVAEKQLSVRTNTTKLPQESDSTWQRTKDPIFLHQIKASQLSSTWKHSSIASASWNQHETIYKSYFRFYSDFVKSMRKAFKLHSTLENWNLHII